MSDLMSGFHTVTHPDGAVYSCFCEVGKNHTVDYLTPDE